MKIPIKVPVQRSIPSSINLIERPPPSGNLVNPRHKECRDAGALEVGENACNSCGTKPGLHLGGGGRVLREPSSGTSGASVAQRRTGREEGQGAVTKDLAAFSPPSRPFTMVRR